jgi:hypothetical protein
MKAKQDKLHADWTKIDADRQKRRVTLKAFNEMIERREAERKAYEEESMAEQEADRKKRKADFEKMIPKRKADQDKREVERKADQKVATRLEAIHDKTDANQMRVEPKTEHQEKMDAWIADMKDD